MPHRLLCGISMLQIAWGHHPKRHRKIRYHLSASISGELVEFAATDDELGELFQQLYNCFNRKEVELLETV